ncbi:hypothetical protein [Pseudomonas sp. TMP25]|uniref:hypothetical protein n=1 Tax=Pseudomonas sp. TMP25 TaxID=3136561 RepID=UPI0031017983
MAFETEVIAALTALAAVVIGPVVTWKVAKSQINAHVVSTNRQAWINELRDTLALFVRDAYSVKQGYSAGIVSKNDAFARFEEMVLAKHKIELMLNSNESEHQELLRLLNSSIEYVREALSCIYSEKEYSNNKNRLTAIRAITPIAQKILKSKWIRVKQGQ